MTEPEITPPPAKPKRPAEFTDEIFDAICDRMANGEGLRKICEDPQMPSRQTFLRWIEKDTGRQNKYQAAREALMDWYGEEILTIAWDDSGDIIDDGKGRKIINNAKVQRDREKISTLKFLMAKLHPRRYGDKLPEQEGERDLKLSWEKQQPEQVTEIRRIILQGVPAESHLQERIRELEAQLAEARGGNPAAPPKLLTYDPGPLPKRVDPEILIRMTELIRANVPKADQRPPEEVLEEVLSVCAKALEREYAKPPEIDGKSIWEAAE